MTDGDRIQRLEDLVARIARHIEGQPARIAESGGEGEETYRLIRGQSVGVQSGATILIDNVLELAGGLDPSGGNPATQITVSNLFGQSFSDNEAVQAIYHEGLGSDETDSWETIKTAETTETPPLWRFELTAAKATTDATATAKWLDHAGNMVGSDVTIHDPGLKFYGKAADYVGTIDGFRGFAIQRTDLAEVDPARFEIIAMEGFARWAVVTYVGSPTNEWQLTSFGGDQWQWKRPVADSAALTITDPAGVNASPSNGDVAIAELVNPDTSPPTYQLRVWAKPDRLVASGTSDGVPATLIQKTHNVTSYNAGTDRLVEAEEFDDGGTRKVRYYLDISDLGGGSGDTVAEGYATDIEGSGTVTIHNDPTEWTGFGATYQFFVHTSAASARTDPKWETISGYSTSGTYLLGIIDGVWQLKTIAEWLNLLTGYTVGNDQSIGHDASSVTEWQDDGACS